MSATSSPLGVGQAAENYIKAIYSLQRRNSHTAPVATNDLAPTAPRARQALCAALALDVSAASTSAMVNKLAGQDLVSHQPYRTSSSPTSRTARDRPDRTLV